MASRRDKKNRHPLGQSDPMKGRHGARTTYLPAQIADPTPSLGGKRPLFGLVAGERSALRCSADGWNQSRQSHKPGMYRMYTTHWQFALVVALVVAISSYPALGSPPDDQYAVAAGHYANDRWRLAADELLVFLDKYPDDKRVATVTFFLAEALLQMGRYEQARGNFLEFLRREPLHQNARQALFRTGEAAYLSGNSAEARRRLAQFREKYPDDQLNAYALPYEGALALDVGDGQTARSIYMESLHRYPDGPLADECRFGLGRAHQLLGEAEAAIRTYQRIAKNTKHPLADDAQFEWGLLQYERQKYAEAAKTLAVFDSTFRDSDHLTEARYWLAMTQMARREWGAAVETLGRAAGGQPRHSLAPAIAYYTGESSLLAGRVNEAAKHYDRVLGDWPDSTWADDSLRGRMQVALAAEDHAKVDTLAAQFDHSHPDSALRDLVRETLGRSLLKRQSYTAAIEVFQDLVKRQDDTPEDRGGGDTFPVDPVAEPVPSAADPRKDHIAGEVDRKTDQSNWYLLALAYLGAKRHPDVIAALDRVRPSGRQRELVDGVLAARASALIGLEKYDESVESLEAYLASRPDGPDAAKCRAELTVALAKTGKFEKARTVYDDYVRQHPQDALFLPATHYLAEAAYASGDRQSAHELFSVLARDGNPADYVAKGLSGVAWSQLESDRPVESAATFERLLNDYPDSPFAAEAALARAQALEKVGQNDAALATYHVVLDKYPHSKELPSVLLGAARLHDRLQQDKQADALYERLMKEYPRLPQRAAALYQWAWVLVDLERASDADAVFARIHERHKTSHHWADATYRLAERAANERDFDRAGKLTDELIDAKTDGKVLSYTLYLQGQLAATSGRWAEVAGPCVRLAGEFPDSPLRLPAAFLIAEADYRQGRYDKAGEQFDVLARKTQGRTEAWLAMIPLRQAQVRAHHRQWQEAHDLAVTIAARFTDFSKQHEVDYLLGRCLAGQGKFDEARAAYERVLSSPAGDKTETAAMAQWMTGETHFHQKRFDEAIKAYLRVEILYDYPRWQAGGLLQAGKCQEMKGEWKQAVELYARLLKQYPNTTFTEQALRRLSVARQRARLARTR